MISRLTILFFVVILLSSCNEAILNNSPKKDFPILLELNIDEGKSGRWQDVDVTFSVTNISNETVTYGFSSSCQIGYTVERNGKLIFDSRSNFVCLAVITEFKLKSGESKVFPVELVYLDGVTIPNGTYRIGAFLLEGHSSTVYNTLIEK